jgi:hypothetical protein
MSISPICISSRTIFLIGSPAKIVDNGHVFDHLHNEKIHYTILSIHIFAGFSCPVL